VALSAHRQTGKLLEQVRACRPSAVALSGEHPSAALVEEIRSLGAAVYRGPGGLVEMVQRDDVDVVLAGIVGAAGLPAALAAVAAGKTLALANKEALVVGGSLLVPEARRRGVTILPVDSEHSAVFQAMQCGRLHEVRRVLLTASGGPFLNATPGQIESATVEEALNHPTWRMGHKITIDSATMFNKALEIIEACWLFDLPPEKVEVVVHPESIIHSMVEFVDGSVVAQLSPPDMRTPIQYALTYPHRAEGLGRRLDLRKALSLNLAPPDVGRFPAIRLAYEAVKAGGTMGAVLSAANEGAVAAFLARRIPFGRIAQLVESAMESHRPVRSPALDELLEADRWARQTVEELIEPSSASQPAYSKAV
jgi:1-deoxy-D-xylulose-5-phosphate reductoisomerase